MSNSDPSFVPTAISSAVGAILTIAQAVPTIDKRLGRVSDIESQIGPLPALVQNLYVKVQRFYKRSLFVITVVGMVMVLAYIAPAVFTHWVFNSLRSNGAGLLVIWLVLGAVMYSNSVSVFLRWSCWALTALVPFRRKLKIQRLDRNPAWQALGAFIDLNENARPLIVNIERARTFVDTLLTNLKTAPTVSNRAVPPARPEGMEYEGFRRRLANGLLAACVIEEMHHERGSTFPRREWGPFYEVIGVLVVDTDLLSVQTLHERHSDDGYYDEFLGELNTRLSTHGQTKLPSSPDLAFRLKRTFFVLHKEYGADATAIDPGEDRATASRLEIIYERVASLPTLTDEGMQRQFVKLAIVWAIFPNVIPADFRFPFSSQIAALLLDRRIILVPDDVKVLAFDKAADRAVQEASMRVVVELALRLIEERREDHLKWLPQPSRDASGDSFRWWVTYELDFRIWDYAWRLHRAIAADDENLTHWKYSSGQVVRL